MLKGGSVPVLLVADMQCPQLQQTVLRDTLQDSRASYREKGHIYSKNGGLSRVLQRVRDLVKQGEAEKNVLHPWHLHG